jgi:hypothetical protein
MKKHLLGYVLLLGLLLSSPLRAFISPDPEGHVASMDLYSYCNGDPVNQYDADGRITIVIPGYGPQEDLHNEKNGWINSNVQFIRNAVNANPGAIVFSRDNGNMSKAFNAINSAVQNGDNTVNIIGYSRGGVAALNLATSLNNLSGIQVNNLTLIDPVVVRAFGDTLSSPLNVPSNVKNATDYYQNSGNPLQMIFNPFNFIGTPLANANNDNIKNIPLIPIYGNGVMHQNIQALVNDDYNGYKLSTPSPISKGGCGN